MGSIPRDHTIEGERIIMPDLSRSSSPRQDSKTANWSIPPSAPCAQARNRPKQGLQSLREKYENEAIWLPLRPPQRFKQPFCPPQSLLAPRTRVDPPGPALKEGCIKAGSGEKVAETNWNSDANCLERNSIPCFSGRERTSELICHYISELVARTECRQRI